MFFGFHVIHSVRVCVTIQIPVVSGQWLAQEVFLRVKS